jgi:hypothetical protein
MTPGTAAMLLGIFAVPGALLWLGHRLRRRSPFQRAIFWGALVGYFVAASLALYAAMVPAAMWSADDTVRGLVGFWSFLIGPVVGGLIAAVRAPSRSA